MTKREIRSFLREILLEKPTKKWQATARVVDRGIWLGWAGLIWVTSAVTNNMGVLMLLIWIIVGVFIIYYYFVARGR